MSRFNIAFIIENRIKRTFSSLKHSDFRIFWTGQCVSWVGIWMQRTAQVWLVYMLTSSPFILGLLGFFQFAPMLLISLPAGVIVDKFPKKKIIFWTQVGFMIQSFSLAFLVWFGKVEAWNVLVMTAIFGSLQAVDGPARQSFFIDLVGKEDLPNAISLNSTISQLSKFLGPMTAGYIMTKFGIGFCFLLNTVTYIPVFVTLFKIKAKGEPQSKQNNSDNIFMEIRDGIAHILHSRSLIATILFMFIFCTFAMNTSIIIPVFADKVLNRGVDGYTGLLSATGIGAFTGAIYMANRSKTIRKVQLIFDTVAISLIHIAVGLTKNYSLSLFYMFFAGFLSITFLNMVNSILQINTSDAYRGRVMSLYTFVNQGSHPLGNIFAGAVMEYAGASISFVSCGLIILVLMSFLFIKFPMNNFFYDNKC